MKVQTSCHSLQKASQPISSLPHLTWPFTLTALIFWTLPQQSVQSLLAHHFLIILSLPKFILSLPYYTLFPPPLLHANSTQHSKFYSFFKMVAPRNFTKTLYPPQCFHPGSYTPAFVLYIYLPLCTQPKPLFAFFISSMY